MEDSKKNYRTAARTHITDFLKKNADRSVSVHDIMKSLEEDSFEVNISTVYRYLGKLSEEGVVNKYSSDNGEQALFQYTAPSRNCDDHLHMQCKECGRMIHLDCDFMDEITEHIMKHHGFEISCKGSVLYGICEKCRSAVNVLALFVILTLSTLLMSGCSNIGSNTGFADDGKLHIVTTIYAAYDFARQIGDSRVDVRLLLKPGSEAHTFEPTPADIITIEQCDIFICSGGENDSWVDTIIESIDNPDMTIIRMTECVNNLFEEEIVEGMQAEHESSEEEDETEWDEHVWMDLDNAATICQTISDEYCLRDPEGESFYNSLLDAYLLELESIDNEIRLIVNNAPRDELIFADRFPARYFTERYGLKYYAAFPGCSENTEASASTVSFLIDRTREDNISTVLKIELSSGKLASVVSEATGAAIGTFYTGHNITAEDFEAGLTFADMMRRNAELLAFALY